MEERGRQGDMVSRSVGLHAAPPTSSEPGHGRTVRLWLRVSSGSWRRQALSPRGTPARPEGGRYSLSSRSGFMLKGSSRSPSGSMLLSLSIRGTVWSMPIWMRRRMADISLTF